MLASNIEMGSKQLGTFESLEFEENRVQKRLFNASSPPPPPSPSLDGISVVAAMQHRGSNDCPWMELPGAWKPPGS